MGSDLLAYGFLKQAFSEVMSGKIDRAVLEDVHVELLLGKNKCLIKRVPTEVLSWGGSVRSALALGA